MAVCQMMQPQLTMVQRMKPFGEIPSDQPIDASKQTQLVKPKLTAQHSSFSNARSMLSNGVPKYALTL